jgi:hypothetical protein
MLKNFLYLNDSTLSSYLSSLEDGLRDSVAEKKAKSSSVSAKAGFAGIGTGGEHERQREEVTSRSDTPESRFERLRSLALEDTETSGWMEVADTDKDLEAVKIGSLVEIRCEIYIPEVVKALSSSGGLVKTIEQFQSLSRFAPAFGTEIQGMPPADQLDAVKGFASALGADAMLVGEPEDTEWRVAGKLLEGHLCGEIEGSASVVGKVSAIWKKGQWKPLLALPGMNLISRDQRREMERRGPDQGQEQNWLEGPALMLDVLAVYR